MENWDLAAKYSEISANASGTAAKKMEAYTDSIEAAQNRVTVAIEKWSEFFNGSDLIKGFYDKLSFLIENIDVFGATILAIVGIMNANSVWKTMVNASVSFQTKMIDLATTFTKVKSNLSGTSFKTDKVGIGNILNEQVIASQQQAYASSLNKYILSLDSLSKQNLINLQNEMLRETTENKQQIANLLLLDLSEEEATEKAKIILQSSKTELMQTLLNTLSESERKAKIQEIQKSKECSEAEAELILASRQLAKQRKTQAGQAIGTNVKDSMAVRSASSLVVKGAGSIVGGVLGGYAGSGIGETIGGSTGQILGGTLGGIAGSAAVSSLVGTIAGGTVTLGSVAGPVGILLGLVGGSVYTLWKKHKQEMIEEAQQEFADLQSTFTDKLTASAQTIEYDELVKGVDSLGNNVSLTEEEYQKFLDTSNALAEAFPELVVRTDEAGNSFLGLNGKVGTITDSVNELTDALQKQVDVSLLSEEVFGETLNENKTTKEDLEKEIKNLEQDLKDTERTSFNPDTQKLRAQNKVLITKELEEKKKELENFAPDYSDWVQAVIRSNDSLSDSYENLTDEQKQFVDLFSSSLDVTDMNRTEAINYIKDNLEDIIENLDSIPINFEIDDDNIDEYDKMREELLESILEAPYIDDEVKDKFLIKIGFEYVDGEWIDSTNPLKSIQRDFNITENGGKNQLTIENLSKLELEDIQKAYTLLKDGTIDATTSMETLVNLIYADREVPEGFESLNNYLQEISKNSIDAMEKIDEFSFEDWKNLDEKEITEMFSSLPESWRNGIKELKEEIENGDIGEDELTERLSSLYSTFSDTTIDIMSQLAEISLQNIFRDSLEGIEGSINSMTELQSALKEVANSYELLGDAQEEQAEKGKLSLSTVVDLLSENINYAQVLDFVKSKDEESIEAIKLKSNAQEIMAQLQINAIKNNLQAAIAEEEQTIATKEARIAIIDKALGITEDDIPATQNAIETTNTFGKVMSQAGKIVAYLAVALSSLLTGSLDNFSENLSKVTSAFEWEDVNTDWEETYSKMTKEELEEEKAKLVKEIENSQANIDTYKYAYEHLSPDTIESELGGYLSDSSSKDDWDLEDLLDAIESLIDKEYEAMQVFDELTGKVTGETKYFDKMADVLTRKIALYKEMIASGNLTESEYYDYQNKLIQAEVQFANLDDERLEDEISLAETREFSLKTLIALQQEYLKTADTEEEAVERQKELNELIEEEYDERKRIREFEQSFINTALDRQSGNAWSDGELYEELINLQKQSYQEAAQDALNRIEQQTQKYIGIYMEEGYSFEQAEELAKKTEAVQDATQDYLDAIEAQAELVITKVTDKLNEIDQKISDLENRKPKTWTDIDQITEFAEKNIELLEAKIPALEEALSDTSMMTDEQVQDLVNQLNDVTVALHEAQISLREEIQQYQENQFSALEWKVQQIIGELEDEMDKIDEAYEPILEDLENANKERERAIELEDLLANKLNKEKEKERVYREGKICP